MKNVTYVIIAAIITAMMSSISIGSDVENLEEQLLLMDVYNEEFLGPLDFDDPDFINESQGTLELNFDYSEE